MRKNKIFDQVDQIREEKKKIQIRMLGQERKKKKSSGGMKVPKYVASSKHIMDEKKEAQSKAGK